MASQAAENGASVEFKEIPLSSSIPRATVPKQKDYRIWFLHGIIGALVLAVLVLAIFAGILFFTSRFQKGADHTLGEVRSAYRLQSSINFSVNPCEDFYEYVCGQSISEMEVDSGAFGILQEVASKKLDKLIRSTERSSSTAIEKVKSFYRSCMDDGKYSQLAVQEARQEIKSLGEFPILDGINSENFSWPEHVLFMAKKGRGFGILGLAIGRNEKNRSKTVIKFGVNSFLLNDVDWNNKTSPGVLFWKKMTKNELEIFAKDVELPPNPQLEKDLDDLIDFYARLKNIIKKEEIHSTSFFPGDSLPKMMAGDEEKMIEEKFTTLVDRFWKRTGLNLRQLLIDKAPSFAHDFLVNEDLLVHISSPQVEDSLVDLIRETPSNTWKNFYQLELLAAYRIHFPEKYREGSSTKIYCLAQARGFGYAFDAIYVRGQDSVQEKKEEVLEMVKNLKDSFSQIIQEADWLDEETKKNAQIKLKQQLVKIGYHESVLDDNQLDAIYKDLNFNEDMPYLTMVKELHKWILNKSWERVLKPQDRNVFGMSSATVNAMFVPSENSITFPFAILHDPFFDLDAPKSLNYGGIGGVIGHEITHGFDSTGRKYDEIGNKRMWWTNSSNENFERKAKLIVDQYNNYELKGMNLNGKQTLEENIADNGAIKESFRAYKKYLKRNGREKPLPSLNLTNEQLFYIGWGRVWCSKESPESLKSQILIGVHSPDKARTNIVVSNQPEFAEAFNCPAGSPMNPVKKVTVW